MFRRTDKAAVSDATTHEPKEGGKGRPTPSRKEAEAAAKVRARTVMDKKAASKVLRDGRAKSNQAMREGMKRGEEKYLLPRDQGPTRRFIRDYIDSRWSFLEFLLPALIIVMILGYSGSDSMQRISFTMQLAVVMLALVDTLWLRFRLRREVRARFPDERLRGITFYALLRVLQIRPLRVPKPQVKIGQQLPEHYR